MSLFGRKVRFLCDNYVLESDDLLEMAQPEFDTILCLSTTKWIHLNFGDDGIKRAFKRMYAQLKPGEIIFKEFSHIFLVFSKWN
jgi:7SK snRNA methylphosphate capping enzyme